MARRGGRGALPGREGRSLPRATRRRLRLRAERPVPAGRALGARRLRGQQRRRRKRRRRDVKTPAAGSRRRGSSPISGPASRGRVRDLPSDRAGRRARGCHRARTPRTSATIHAWSDGGRRRHAPHDHHGCDHRALDAITRARRSAPTVARRGLRMCRGAAVPSESTRDDTTASFGGASIAALGRVDFSAATKT